MRFFYFLLFGLISILLVLHTSAEFILIGSAAIAVTTILSSYFILPETCLLKECCTSQYISTSLSVREMERNMSASLFGQHIALQVIPKLIIRHLENQKPTKALVMSFHGTTGVGKNYVTQLLADLMYKEGMRSQFVHLFIPDRHFGHAHLLPQYKTELAQWIQGNVTQCPLSVFIFDEAENLPATLIDVLKPFMESFEHLDGVDYRKTIFIFLSNIGAGRINEYALQHYDKGLLREEIQAAVMENMLTEAAFSDTGGFLHCKLIKHHLISAFVPFLPLEKEHVRKCIRKYLQEQYNMNRHSTIEEKVLNRMEFEPNKKPLYATTGCRRIPEFTDQAIEEFVNQQ